MTKKNKRKVGINILLKKKSRFLLFKRSSIETIRLFRKYENNKMIHYNATITESVDVTDS